MYFMFRHEFVDLYVDMVLNRRVEKQFNVFKDAFLKVCGGRVLRLFHSQELMAVVVGNQDYNWIEWENNAEYKNGYTKDDETIKMFWEVFHDFNIDDKKKFLLFLTGSDRVPIMGMKAIKVSNFGIFSLSQLLSDAKINKLIKVDFSLFINTFTGLHVLLRPCIL